MPTLTQAVPTTAGQIKLITRIIADVGDHESVQKALAGLDKESAERLKGDPAFAESMRQNAIKLIAELSVTNQFADEEVESSYGYLSGYRKPADIAAQAIRLKKLFPELSSDIDGAALKASEANALPNAEGLSLIPRWQKIAPTYGEAVQKVLDLLKEAYSGKFYNYREGELGPNKLRESEKKTAVMQGLFEAQGECGVLIVQTQFGLRHRGRSVRRARAVMNASEFGLGAFEVGVMLLLNENRLKHLDDLWIDCAGDEFAPGGVSVFSSAPCFVFGDDELEFDADGVGIAYDSYGSASGFVPQ